MSEKTNLTNLELQVTQKIQLQFPRGVIPSEVLTFWDNCPANILRAKLLESFGTIPVSAEEKIDTIIRVDRTVPPTYESWVKEVKHKDLELVGPAEYNINKVEQYLLPKQEKGIVTGNDIYKHMTDNGMLKNQLGLADLLAIQVKGITFFRKYFAGKAVFGWKSVVLNVYVNLLVPYLVEHGGQVVLYWYWIDYNFNSYNPALQFAS